MSTQSRNNRKIILGLGLFILMVALACQVSVPLINEENASEPRRNTDQSERLPAAEFTQPAIPVGPTPTLVEIPQAVVDEQSLLVNLYARINPSVVNITDYGSQGGELVPISQGSGYVFDTQGHIITNAHVVLGAEEVEVTFADASVQPAEVLGADLYSDLAVIRVTELPQGVNPLPFGSMEDLAVGQTVVAIGNPFGLEGTLTRGVISALGRSIPALVQSFSIPQSIQTDAAINPGNSGGPLLNLEGEVIGVNAQIETGGEGRSNLGIGFAIPVNLVQRVVPDLIERGEHVWAYFGVSGDNLNSTQIEAMNLPVNKGAYIARVIEGGPSAEAGLRGSQGTEQVEGRTVEVGGDVVTAINGQPIATYEDLLIYIALNASPGDSVTLTVIRDGETMDLVVTLGERPAADEEQNLIPLPLQPDSTLPPDHP
jgi:2-alkenal reductase